MKNYVSILVKLTKGGTAVGLLSGAKDQMVWGNLKYTGGYPNKIWPFVCGIYNVNGEIEVRGASSMSQFSIPKEDILDLKIRNNNILMKIKYETTEIRDYNLQLQIFNFHTIKWLP